MVFLRQTHSRARAWWGGGRGETCCPGCLRWLCRWASSQASAGPRCGSSPSSPSACPEKDRHAGNQSQGVRWSPDMERKRNGLWFSLIIYIYILKCLIIKYPCYLRWITYNDMLVMRLNLTPWSRYYKNRHCLWRYITNYCTLDCHL